MPGPSGGKGLVTALVNLQIYSYLIIMKVLLCVFCVTPAGVLPQCVLLKHIPEAYFVVKTIESRVSKNENNLF